MATIVLSAAGMAVGGSIGGSVLGLGMATIGRAVGATMGQMIDQRLMGAGSDPVETGRVDRFRLTGASEGRGIGHIYGRMRVGGQVIWATQFKETTRTSGGGKGTPPGPRVTEYSYAISLAIALCEGTVSRIGRIWADGEEIGLDQINMRLYPGDQTQLPDPAIEAVEGAGQAPAYRGTAYVVFEDLDLGLFGNRVPQFSFEVMRGAGEAGGDLADQVQGVALIPGTGEYSLATSPVYMNRGLGRNTPVNLNTPSGQTDFSTSLTALSEELPGCGSVVTVVSWFGTDLRAGECEVAPRVEQKEADGVGMPWQVSGLDRWSAEEVASDNGAALYGGTPADAAVIEGMRAIAAKGMKPVFYPFILMEPKAGNTLTNPWTGTQGQPALPWRGRITTSLAPGVNGTPDGTAQADAEVAAFLGSAQPSDFSVSGETVTYTGPAEWSYRRFILHYAHLCQIAGGVDAFVIGSELRGLTQIRGANGFPFVDGLIQLLGEVRVILGPDVKLSYAADWSEYHGYQPPGTADKLFHLDPLWAHPELDFIGIDNYLPLSDWREGEDHADAHWGSIYNLDYLKANIEGGEYYDWYYPTPEAEAAQRREPITDGLGEPWVWRAKDIRGWWENPHHDRVGGQKASVATPWMPQSKPIWFTEIGCAAIDKGTNQPNRFLDPKSSESALPRASLGLRDDFIQMQYIRAMSEHYADRANNPISVQTGLPMVDTARTHVWAWDARPYPAFPGRPDIWSDDENYARGHWLNGRAVSRALASVVEEICAASGVTEVDTSALYGVVRGYAVPDVGTARERLQPLMLAYGFDAVERDGVLAFRNRGARPVGQIAADDFATLPDGTTSVELSRAQAPEIAGRVQLGFVDADGDYEARAVEAVFPDGQEATVSRSELALAMTEGEGLRIAERWLSEARVARDTARFALPPSAIRYGAGDVLRLPDGAGDGLYRVDVAELTDRQMIEAVRVEPTIYAPQDTPDVAAIPRPFTAPVPVAMTFMDLPLLRGNEDPIAPHTAVAGVPWPGSVALYTSGQDSGYALERLYTEAAVIGETETPLNAAAPGVWDRGQALHVRLVRGALDSADPAAVLAGANLAAIGDGSTGNWEVFQFAEAELIAPDTYALRMRLRGQAGTDGLMPPDWPAGSIFVLLDERVPQIGLAPAARGTERHFRYGPARKPMDDPTYQYRTAVFEGAGLRPYPVAHLQAARVGGDVALNWKRRTRIDGDPWGAGDVPLGETAEEYRVRVWQGQTQLREATISSPAWTYGAAQQAADGASGSVYVDVAQVSDRVGAGPARGITVDL